MIKICPTCSKISKEKLIKYVSDTEIEQTCIDVCQKFDDKCFGMINNKLYYVDSEDEFIKIVKEKLQK